MSAVQNLNLTDHFHPLAIGLALKGRPGTFSEVFGPEARQSVKPCGLRDVLRSIESQHGISSPAALIAPQASMTSDTLPGIIQDANNLLGIMGYASANLDLLQASHESLSIENYLPQNRAKLSGYPALQRVAEGSEIEYGYLNDRAESYMAFHMARILKLSIESIFNDRTDLLAQQGFAAGYAAAEAKVASLVDLIEGNPNLSDNLPVFHEDHNNDIPNASVTLDGMRTALGSATARMQRQKDLAGVRPAPVTPAYILCPPELSIQAQQLVADVSASSVQDVNVFARKLRVITEPRLANQSTWYLLARPDEQMSLEHGVVAGTLDPEVRSETPIGENAIVTRVSLSFGCGWLDYRGAVRIRTDA